MGSNERVGGGWEYCRGREDCVGGDIVWVRGRSRWVQTVEVRLVVVYWYLRSSVLGGFVFVVSVDYRLILKASRREIMSHVCRI